MKSTSFTETWLPYCSCRAASKASAEALCPPPVSEKKICTRRGSCMVLAFGMGIRGTLVFGYTSSAGWSDQKRFVTDMSDCRGREDQPLRSGHSMLPMLFHSAISNAPRSSTGMLGRVSPKPVQASAGSSPSSPPSCWSSAPPRSSTAPSCKSKKDAKLSCLSFICCSSCLQRGPLRRRFQPRTRQPIHQPLMRSAARSRCFLLSRCACNSASRFWRLIMFVRPQLLAISIRKLRILRFRIRMKALAEARGGIAAWHLSRTSATWNTATNPGSRLRTSSPRHAAWRRTAQLSRTSRSPAGKPEDLVSTRDLIPSGRYGA
mmetsp:Transcript_81374/g.181020  ORF Transcript_81374/g.181020 Transcript_81374/m.181020 type:complete len:319 (-) Transcript_81374:51-1007(-)